MKMGLSREDFSADVLSYKATALLSEFALILYRQYGILIDVNSNDVLLRVFQNALRCKDRRLKAIYLHIKTEMCVHLVKSKKHIKL